MTDAKEPDEEQRKFAYETVGQFPQTIAAWLAERDHGRDALIRAEAQIALLDELLIACGRLVPDHRIDQTGQLFGISSAKEVLANRLKTLLNRGNE